MLARNVTEGDLRAAAEIVGVDILEYRPNGKTGARFRLAPRRVRTPAEACECAE